MDISLVPTPQCSRSVEYSMKFDEYESNKLLNKIHK